MNMTFKILLNEARHLEAIICPNNEQIFRDRRKKNTEKSTLYLGLAATMLESHNSCFSS